MCCNDGAAHASCNDSVLWTTASSFDRKYGIPSQTSIWNPSRTFCMVPLCKRGCHLELMLLASRIYWVNNGQICVRHILVQNVFASICFLENSNSHPNVSVIYGTLRVSVIFMRSKDPTSQTPLQGVTECYPFLSFSKTGFGQFSCNCANTTHRLPTTVLRTSSAVCQPPPDPELIQM